MGVTNNFKGVSSNIKIFVNNYYVFCCLRFGEKIDITYLTDLLAFNDPLHCMNFLEESRNTIIETKVIFF